MQKEGGKKSNFKLKKLRCKGAGFFGSTLVSFRQRCAKMFAPKSQICNNLTTVDGNGKESLFNHFSKMTTV
jgi:hypothetical protein